MSSIDLDIDNQDAAEYWRFYGMQHDPFASDEAKGLYFPGGDRDELLQTAKHVARFSQQPVVFYGPEGVGKTTLLAAVAAGIGNETLVLTLRAGFMTTTEQIFAEIAQALEMHDVNFIPSAFRGQIINALGGQEEEKTSLLLLVDDAHDLIDKTLHSLQGLASDSEPDVRVLFFASTDGNGFLRPELDRSDVQQLAIQPLDGDDIEEYLKYRLGEAGFDREFPFTEEDLDNILKQSLGIPERIGRVAEQKLRQKIRIASIGQSEGSPASSKRRLPVLHMCLVAGLLALVVALVFWGRGGERVEPQVVVTSDAEPTLHQPTVIDAVDTEEKEHVKDEKAAVQTIVAEPVRTAEDLAELEVKDEVKLDEAVQKEVVQKVAPKVEALNPFVEPVVVKDESEKSKNKPVVEVVENSTSSPAMPVAPVSVPVPASSVPVASSLTEDERALLALEGGHFTLQLASSSSRVGANDLAARYAQLGARVFSTVRANKDWYIVVLGDFVDKTAAASHVKSLPQQLRKDRPWARSLTAVHAEINKGRGL